MKTKLLVSVRDASEAVDALAAGTDLIDLKEPRRGSLGAVEPHVMREVVAAVAGRAPVSAALGELLDNPPLADVPPGIQLAKLGLAGCSAQTNWPDRLADAIGRLPEGVQAVAVAYADGGRADAPAPDQVLDVARRLGCRAVLVDTWQKGAGGLLDLWTVERCASFVAQVHEARLMAVIGGSLTVDGLRRLLPIAPDYLAVRGAACDADRAGRLSFDRVRELAAIVRHGQNGAASATSRPHARATAD
ncbi:MAG TPA: (5-formylfuran-3-yl)methyl phosphate synthase [Pirellulales bacterium]|nr:(5-formylfuran-3-yl)methyl phosphate synthase [Pirellulales bacterium]